MTNTKQRRAQRIPLRVEVLVGTRSVVRAEYRARDLSALGIGISGFRPLDELSLHAFRISGRSSDDEMVVTGRVVWCRTGSRLGEYEMGIEFVDLDADGRRAISRIMELDPDDSAVLEQPFLQG